MRRTTAGMVCAGLSIAVLAEGAPPSASPIGGDGVADPAGRMGYLRKPGGGVEGIELSSGKPRWDAPQLLRPLWATEKELAGLSTSAPATSTSRVLFLDGKSGKQRVASQPLVFPEWVTLDGLTTVAWLEGEQLLLRWEAHRRKPGGP